MIGNSALTEVESSLDVDDFFDESVFVGESSVDCTVGLPPLSIVTLLLPVNISAPIKYMATLRWKIWDWPSSLLD